MPLPDTTVDGSNTIITGRCYYNCVTWYSKDSTISLLKGNIELPGPGSSIADGTKTQADFNSIRSAYGLVYVYDALDDGTYDYLDSVLTTSCVRHMYRGVKNRKYVYWYATQPVPDSVTNIVRIK